MHDHLEESGVSVDLVFRIDQIRRMLTRIERLSALLFADGERGPRALRLAVELVRSDLRDRSLAELGRTNIRLLAQKIIERAGDTGEHYITTTRAEYDRALTAITAVLKYVIGGIAIAPFFAGLFASLNYAASFVLMQLLGFTLATKQPSMTAAALALAMKETPGRDGVDTLVDQIARTARSQLAAVIGNIGMVIPVCLAIHYALVGIRGHGFFDAEEAEHVVTSLSPIKSGAVFYAAFTGVLLWGSSIAAGWLENWAVYRRLPEALARHRGLRRVVGDKRAGQLSRAFSHHISGIGGSVSLGIALGMTPVVAKFFGLPLDVRHVTLSTGALTFAGATLGPYAVVHSDFLWAVLGIACIGALNFGVSFSLALFVALRAREVRRGTTVALMRALVSRFVRRPWTFIFPPKA